MLRLIGAVAVTWLLFKLGIAQLAFGILAQVSLFFSNIVI
jgi:hypothetical protein